MASATGFACGTEISRVDEADKFRAFAVQQRKADFGVGTAGVVPGFWVERLYVRGVLHGAVGIVTLRTGVGFEQGGVAAVAVGTTEFHTGVGVHGFLVTGGVAGHAASAFSLNISLDLLRGCGWIKWVVNLTRAFATCSVNGSTE